VLFVLGLAVQLYIFHRFEATARCLSHDLHAPVARKGSAHSLRRVRLACCRGAHEGGSRGRESCSLEQAPETLRISTAWIVRSKPQDYGVGPAQGSGNARRLRGLRLILELELLVLAMARPWSFAATTGAL